MKAFKTYNLRAHNACGPKINKDKENLNNTINKLDVSNNGIIYILFKYT